MRDRTFDTLQSDRLVLRRFHIGDRVPFFELRNIENVARYQSWPYPYTDSEVRTFIRSMINSDPGIIGEWFQFAVALKGSNRFIGDIGLKPIKVPDGQFMLGYSLFPNFEGKGYMTEALRTLINYAFSTLGQNKALAYVDARNERSIRLLKRLGFEELKRWENFGLDDAEETLLFMVSDKMWRAESES